MDILTSDEMDQYGPLMVLPIEPNEPPLDLHAVFPVFPFPFFLSQARTKVAKENNLHQFVTHLISLCSLLDTEFPASGVVATDPLMVADLLYLCYRVLIPWTPEMWDSVLDLTPTPTDTWENYLKLCDFFTLVSENSVSPTFLKKIIQTLPAPPPPPTPAATPTLTNATPTISPFALTNNNINITNDNNSITVPAPSSSTTPSTSTTYNNNNNTNTTNTNNTTTQAPPTSAVVEPYEVTLADFAKWTWSQDQQLVSLSGMHFHDSGMETVFKLNDHMHDPAKEESMVKKYPDLMKFPKRLLLARFAFLRHVWGKVNIMESALLSVLSRSETSHLFQLVMRNNFILGSSRDSIIENAIDKMPGGSGRPTINLQRVDFGNSVDAATPLFTQAFNQLYPGPVTQLFTRDQAWKVKLIGEGATDAGGPYRETLSTMCTELMSDRLQLLIPCPNARDNTGQNLDQWVINPSAVTASQLQHFEFLGMLMAIAVRTSIPLSLDISRFVWKQIVGIPIDPKKDLLHIDVRVAELLRGLSNGELVDDEDVQIFFTTKLSDNTEVELKPEGRGTKVSKENVEEYIELVENVRMKESEKQIEAIRTGFSKLLPLKVLPFFSWEEWEEKITGKPDVPITDLKNFVKFSGLSQPDRDRLIEYFWKCMEEFTTKERCMFVRFACGLSRLPANFKSNRHMKVTFEENGENSLPRSSTCFWTCYLSNYPNQEIMKQKILTAISSCTDIDADYTI